MDWLKRQEPEIVWDDVGHAPELKSSADWIKAGEIVFDAPIVFRSACWGPDHRPKSVGKRWRLGRSYARTTSRWATISPGRVGPSHLLQRIAPYRVANWPWTV